MSGVTVKNVLYPQNRVAEKLKWSEEVVTRLVICQFCIFRKVLIYNGLLFWGKLSGKPRGKPKKHMTAIVNIICYKSKVFANGESPLMIRICKDGKKKFQSLGISVHPDKLIDTKDNQKVRTVS